MEWKEKTMRAYTVSEKYQHKRCDKFLLDQLSVPPSVIYKAFRKRSIKVNGRRVGEDHLLMAGDTVEVYIPDAYLSEAKPEASIQIPIAYEDEHLLIVSKPQGLSVHGDRHGEESVLDELVRRLMNGREGFPALCHRLDRNTGGLVIMAKDRDTLEIMEDKFRQHEIRKYYLTAVSGIPAEREAELTAYLRKDRSESRVFIFDRPAEGAERIITRYRILKALYPYALLEVELITGKTHQIRAHLAYIGHPILGDGKYGVNSVNRSLKLKYQALFAYRLIFDFKSPSGHLDYLKGLEVRLPRILWEEGLSRTGLELPDHL